MPLKTLTPPEASPRTLPADVAAVTPAASAADSRAHGAADAPAISSAACLTNVLRLDALILILRAKILPDLHISMRNSARPARIHGSDCATATRPAPAIRITRPIA